MAREGEEVWTADKETRGRVGRKTEVHADGPLADVYSRLGTKCLEKSPI